MFTDTVSPSDPPVATSYKIHRLTMTLSQSEVQVEPDFGPTRSFTFTGAQNASFISLVNTGNHTVTSLGRKILQYLIDNGYLTGTLDPET